MDRREHWRRTWTMMKEDYRDWRFWMLTIGAAVLMGIVGYLGDRAGW